MLLPNQIHFIWVGPTLLPDYLETIIRLASVAKRSNFKLNLWVDDEKNFTDVLKNYKYKKNSFYLDLAITAETLGITIRKITDLLTNMIDDPFYQTDSRLKDFAFSVNREMIGFINLAGAADFLRYEAVRQEGGYYFDTDTQFLLHENSILQADDAPLGIKRSVSATNSVFAATINHPVLQDAILYALAAYKRLDQGSVIRKELLDKKTQEDQKILEELKSLEELFKFKMHRDTTQMDLKRYPYYDYQNCITNQRREETIRSSGPWALTAGLDKFIKQIESNHEGPGEADSSSIYFVNKLLGIEISIKSDKLWLAKSKPKSFKGLSFDENSISSSLFFNKKNAERLNAMDFKLKLQ